jgi:hypothetical protein
MNNVNMILTPKSIRLKEVTVKPFPRWQRDDTLSHNLVSFFGKGVGKQEDELKTPSLLYVMTSQNYHHN